MAGVVGGIGGVVVGRLCVLGKGVVVVVVVAGGSEQTGGRGSERVFPLIPKRDSWPVVL